MNVLNEPGWLHRTVALALLGTLAGGAAVAAPMTIEAAITPKADARLDFADGSKRFVIAAQRVGKATGTGPLAGTTMTEWGMHDVNPASGGHATGYLIFTSGDGDIAYLKYQFRAVPVPGPDGKPRFVANGYWETAGGTGKLAGLRGVGALSFDPKDRRFSLTGELASAD